RKTALHSWSKILLPFNSIRPHLLNPSHHIRTLAFDTQSTLNTKCITAPMRPIKHVTIACILALLLVLCVELGSAIENGEQLNKRGEWNRNEEFLLRNVVITPKDLEQWRGPYGCSVTSSGAISAAPASVPASVSSSPTTSVLTAALNSSAPAASGASGASGVSGSAVPTAAPASSANSNQSLPTSASFGNDKRPGSVTWITPTPTASNPPLYKNNANVTLSWAYTDLLVQPVNVTVAAAFPGGTSANTYEITVIPGLATFAVWQLAKMPVTLPLQEGFYTIHINDQRGYKVGYASPGWLMPDHSLTIGIYIPQPYTPRTDRE
ncbi:hypothetical protein BC938DRAFT_481203, partial [Jimgerdemannia flammicorona]